MAELSVFDNLLFLAVVLTVVGVVTTYIAVGIARHNERQRCEEECDHRLLLQRRQLRGS